eukprot:3992861-Amphidinium_carterae.1
MVFAPAAPASTTAHRVLANARRGVLVKQLWDRWGLQAERGATLGTPSQGAIGYCPERKFHFEGSLPFNIAAAVCEVLRKDKNNLQS